MPLLELWKSKPSVIDQYSIEVIVAMAGSGDLRENSECAKEFREYLSQVDSEKLAEYIGRCLSSHFPKSGNALQDLVNELGRRLDYKVTNGRYQGTANAIGFDGIWVSPDGHTLIVEVKTTDAFSISLDTIVGYRDKLLKAGQIVPPSSALIVVGRGDTGGLEAQIRGSRHAWDMRVISADALVKLVQLKESAEESGTAQKIRSLLIPREYTRLDEMIDVMFTTAKDVESSAAVEDSAAEQPADTRTRPKKLRRWDDSAAVQQKRDAILAALARREGTPLIKKSRALYWDSDHDRRAVVIISRRYTGKGQDYWYGYSVPQDEFLSEGGRGYLVLGCMDRDEAFAIPPGVFRPLLEYLNKTTYEDGTYFWHVQLREAPSREVSLILPKEKKNLPLSDFALKLET